MNTATATEPFTTVLPTPDSACPHAVLVSDDIFDTDTVIDPEDFMYDSECDIQRGYSTAVWIIDTCRACGLAVRVHYV